MTGVPNDAAQADLHFIPFPPIERLGTIGDRRTAATIAADGTVNWMCLPRFDGTPTFGGLLDLQKGGFWRLGPEAREFGEQRYLPGTAILVTRWRSADSELELTECMPWPEDDRAPEQDRRRILVRRLRCVSGRRKIMHRAIPREDYRLPATASVEGSVASLILPSIQLGLWSSHALATTEHLDGVHASFTLGAGEEVWAVLDDAAHAADWTVEAARTALSETQAYWENWSGKLACAGPRAAEIRLSAVMVHLLTYAPTGAVIAAPTACLPERIPGNYNYDYRYCWIRDGSLAISLLAQLGVTEPVGKFLTWVSGLVRPPSDDKKQMPLQVLFRIDGGRTLPATVRPDIEGYRSCQPVKFGNEVYQMHEIDGFGFLLDCALMFSEHGGQLTDAHWVMLKRCVDFIAENWDEKDAGTWELMPFENFVSSRVMCWVALDRGIRISAALGHRAPKAWSRARDAVHDDVMEKGWNEQAGSFTQRYGDPALDGTALLIPLLGFLPPDHARVRRTVEAVADVLSINGLVHRFVPIETEGRPDQPMGDREGAFLMCTFWLAQAWSMLGEPAKAEAAIARVEACCGSTGVFSEAGDARHNPGLLGNTPLLFSQVEYARALRVIWPARVDAAPQPG